MWRRAMVYLGLQDDDELEYSGEYESYGDYNSIGTLTRELIQGAAEAAFGAQVVAWPHPPPERATWRDTRARPTAGSDWRELWR